MMPTTFENFDTLKETLPRFTFAQFAAFGILIAERREVLFSYFFGGQEARELRENVVKTLWNIVEGTKVDSVAAAGLRNELEVLVHELYELDDVDYPLQCVKELSSALSDQAPFDWDERWHLAESAMSVAATSGLSDWKAAENEESEWLVVTAFALQQLEKPARVDISRLQNSPNWVDDFRQVKGI